MKIISTIWTEIQEIKSTKKELREFGIVMGIFFGLLAGLLLWKGKNYLPWAVLSGFFFIMGFAAPMLLKPLQKIWMGLAVVIGFFMSHVILGILYFLVVTPISLLARACGQKFLDTEFKKDTASYWHQKPSTPTAKERYEKQF